MLVVSDGEQGWAYNPQRNRVVAGPAGEIETPLPQGMLTELQDTIQEVLDVSNAELVGEEALIGRDAYKLVLSSKEDAEEEFFPGGGTATLWVDKEQWIVLKATYNGGAFGQGSLEVRSFELNPGLADDLFRFEAPEGAELVDVEAEQPKFMTLDEAKEQVYRRSGRLHLPHLDREWCRGDTGWSHQSGRSPQSGRITRVIEPNELAIRAINLTRTFEVGETTVEALRGVNLEVPKGRFVALVGPSGSGKSTFLNLVGGLDRPTDGELWVDGVELSTSKEKTLGADIMALLRRLNRDQGVTLLLVTHDSEAAAFAERVVQLRDGQIA